MNKLFRKVMAAVLASAMLITALSGCNGGGTSSGSSGAGDSSTATSETSSGTESGGESADATDLARNGVGETQYAAGEFLKYDEPLTITFGNNKDINSDGLISMEEDLGEPLTDNRWTRYFEDELNIVTEYQFNIPNATDYNQQLILSMTSGDLPDIFLCMDLSTLKQLAEAGAIADMTTVYKENVNSTLRDVIEGDGTDIYNAMIFDGKLMAIPVKMPSTNGYNHCWVRQDWLDELNLDRPETMEDVYEITKAFKEHYPDNIGMMLNEDYIAEMKGIFWAYGGTTAVRKYWQVLDDGTVGFSEVQPEMKGGLEFLQRLYNEGLVNQEFATEDIATAFEYVANNQCGIFFGPHWYGFRLESAESSMDDSANWVACGLPSGIEGEETKVYATNTFDGVWCVNAEFEHPEALVHLLNAYAEKLFGENNDFENFFACPGNSSCWSASPVHVLDPETDLMPHLQMKEALENDAMDELTGVGKNYWDYIQNGQTAYQYMFGPKDSCFEFVGETYPDIVKWNAYYAAPTPTWADRWSSMEELIDTTYLSIITENQDVDSTFDAMVEEWYSIGGEDVTKEVNDIYATY